MPSIVCHKGPIVRVEEPVNISKNTEQAGRIRMDGFLKQQAVVQSRTN